MFWNQGQLIHNGKYRIERHLGGGGFAVTYLATHTNLNRLVVIKTPNIYVQNDPEYPKYVERFKKEGRMLAHICTESHPHIVQVIDLFEDDKRHCLVMQYIPGMSLWDLVRQQGKLSETIAVKYIHQIGLALVEVHRRNLLHLDVTPLNIMINSESGTGKAVLIDFGIAADMSPPSTLSMSFGNRAFAPYELIRKGVRHPTVDVYCLAASLYYAVTGEMPAKSFDRKYDDEPLISPQQLVSSLSQSCCDAILTGMALEAKERIQTIQQWLDYLTPNPSPYQREGSLNPFLKTWQFEVVKGDATGKITNRRKCDAKYLVEDLGNGVTLEMVQIPGGTFMMGSLDYDGEKPPHQVTVPGFFMGKYPVTQAQYQAVIGGNPSHFKGEKRPVEQVSWDDAVEFCQKISQKTGRTYRLPSEAEWEYACRAGTTTPFYFGETITTELANYRGTDWDYNGTVYPGNYGQAPKGEFRDETTPVGSFPANAFGLYDMHGNVWEWCQDSWHDNYNDAPRDGSAWIDNNNDNQLLRGGSWYDIPDYCRSAIRSYATRAYRYHFVGFRVVVVVA
ncbi:MAG: SUMF1/EgtB/PvdO family nonheme iron enzyme [Methylacidiphilales bacterium]|nr:SUMF1/EgtB/PvdO family nonheme iron enzyme [Candidatus Methylacidiphilales bacterium]